MTNKDFFPSIWLGDFTSKHDFDASKDRLHQLISVLGPIDDRFWSSRHPFAIKAYCAACAEVTTMHLAWHLGGITPEGAVHPAWTETAACEKCGLNSRMRALVDFVRKKGGDTPFQRVYAAERTTPGFQVLKGLFGDLVGSEYLGPDYRPGQTAVMVKGHPLVRHEDLTRLSFADREFDLVITQDVFEHVPDYPKAFAETARILRLGGMLVFTIPFFANLAQTQVRATLRADGIEHHLPPEYHGNPVSSEGSLCFQNFGWDILTELTNAGFSVATASMYWGPWQGHFGFPFFVFSATRS